MLFDVLTVFVVSLISSLFLCNTCVDGFPSSPTQLHYIHSSPSSDSSSSLRLLKHRPVPHADNDLSGDNFEMLIGNPNEDDDSPLSSVDISNDPFEFYVEPPPKFLSRKLLLSQNQRQQKRLSPSFSESQLKFPEVDMNLDELSQADNVVSVNQLDEPIRLSASLKKLVESNPFARAWLTMLLQKLMQEQKKPYIFKYGRRRK